MWPMEELPESMMHGGPLIDRQPSKTQTNQHQWRQWVEFHKGGYEVEGEGGEMMNFEMEMMEYIEAVDGEIEVEVIKGRDCRDRGQDDRGQWGRLGKPPREP